MCDARRNEMRSTTLYALSYPTLSAFEAMKGIGGDAEWPFVLAYTPDFCGFVVCGDDAFCSLGEKKPVENIFELRCFCPTFELRWVREGSENKGRATTDRKSVV